MSFRYLCLDGNCCWNCTDFRLPCCLDFMGVTSPFPLQPALPLRLDVRSRTYAIHVSVALHPTVILFILTSYGFVPCPPLSGPKKLLPPPRSLAFSQHSLSDLRRSFLLAKRNLYLGQRGCLTLQPKSTCGGY